MTNIVEVEIGEGLTLRTEVNAQFVEVSVRRYHVGDGPVPLVSAFEARQTGETAEAALGRVATEFDRRWRAVHAAVVKIREHTYEAMGDLIRRQQR